MSDVKNVMLEIVEPRMDLLTPIADIAMYPKRIELAGRNCYKSEGKITKDSAERFVKMIIRRGHHSVLEHCSITVKFVGDRSMSHQLVRHRIAAYSQESQRYCNYGKTDSLKVIVPQSIYDPKFFQPKFSIVLETDQRTSCSRLIIHRPDGTKEALPEGSAGWVWAFSTMTSYRAYLDLLGFKLKAEDARSVLPNATKTEVVTTYNLRQWRHFFETRCDRHAQWQIRGLALSTLRLFHAYAPCLFNDLYEKFHGGDDE